ncbi:deoxyribodipyrimidine photo-lyase [Agaribacterium sp. ZY112]|uniref:cryptochrome/photolyase family protein n=1 Tax=Agaribacterium sp. ZY112 TaxID=3233574 RepID=UPI003524D24C
MRCLYLFTNDLRLDDNPALNAACAAEYILPVYIHPTCPSSEQAEARNWYLKSSLEELQTSLKKQKLALVLKSGDVLKHCKELCIEHNITHLYCARSYTPEERVLQKKLHQWCNQQTISFKRWPGGLLTEPESIQNQSGSFFKVFTPFYKKVQQQVLRKPHIFQRAHAKLIKCQGDSIHELGLYTSTPDWASDFKTHWQPGHLDAEQRLHEFVQGHIQNYESTRNELNYLESSQLAAALANGEISASRIWQECREYCGEEQAAVFLRQLVWRDFNAHLLFHRPELLTKNFKDSFDAFPWRSTSNELKAWKRGQTGYPVVDAAMRQLWQQGWMPNRARMIVASFLCKHLLIDWRLGERWFWRTLVDADLANNVGGWQWTAGSGADAAPYFRIFNPITQAEKFDHDATYIKTWLPELKHLETRYCFDPSSAPQSVLDKAGIQLGRDYPKPIIEHKEARQRALMAYQFSKDNAPNK